eukprot:scaffold8693_cov119-Isochrysis_galbana.AAC.3
MMSCAARCVPVCSRAGSSMAWRRLAEQSSCSALGLTLPSHRLFGSGEGGASGASSGAQGACATEEGRCGRCVGSEQD